MTRVLASRLEAPIADTPPSACKDTVSLAITRVGDTRVLNDPPHSIIFAGTVAKGKTLPPPPGAQTFLKVNDRSEGGSAGQRVTQMLGQRRLGKHSAQLGRAGRGSARLLPSARKPPC